SSPIYEEKNRQRHCIPAEMGYLLLHTVFKESEVFLLEVAHRSGRLLLQHQGIEDDQIDSESYLIFCRDPLGRLTGDDGQGEEGGEKQEEGERDSNQRFHGAPPQRRFSFLVSRFSF